MQFLAEAGQAWPKAASWLLSCRRSLVWTPSKMLASSSTASWHFSHTAPSCLRSVSSTTVNFGLSLNHSRLQPGLIFFHLVSSYYFSINSVGSSLSHKNLSLELALATILAKKRQHKFWFFYTILFFNLSAHIRQWVSKWVGFNVPPDTVKVISGTAFAGKIAQTHNNETQSLSFTESLTFMKHKT